jgi:hypothetical protein
MFKHAIIAGLLGLFLLGVTFRQMNLSSQKHALDPPCDSLNIMNEKKWYAEDLAQILNANCAYYVVSIILDYSKPYASVRVLNDPLKRMQ